MHPVIVKWSNPEKNVKNLCRIHENGAQKL